MVVCFISANECSKVTMNENVATNNHWKSFVNDIENLQYMLFDLIVGSNRRVLVIRNIVSRSLYSRDLKFYTKFIKSK